MNRREVIICKKHGCNKPVLGCTSCNNKIHTWKNVCCSIECYQAYIKLVLERREKHE